VFNITRPTSVTAKAEGADFAEEVETMPTRSQNICEILSRSVRTSGTMKVLNPAGAKDVMAFQKTNALKKLKADMEFELLNAGTLASGASGTARTMIGVNACISTNVSARNSGTSISVTELEDILQESWTAVGSEYVADTVITTMGIKRAIAELTTRVQPQVQNTKTIYNNVGWYESNSGMVQIVPHKDVINGSGTTHLYALNLDMFKMAFLREPAYEPLAKVGDADRGHYITELTLESRAQRTAVKRTGYSKTG